VQSELFDRVQGKLLHGSQRYVQPAVHHLLRGMIECGECGCGFHSYHRYTAKSLVRGTRRVAHKTAYKCNWRVKEKMHLLDRITRCHNPEVATHLLEGKLMEMIRDIMLAPEKLQVCMEGRPSVAGLAIRRLMVEGTDCLGVAAAPAYRKPWIAFARQKFTRSGFDEGSNHLS
jgi:hypothetical protein